MPADFEPIPMTPPPAGPSRVPAARPRRWWLPFALVSAVVALVAGGMMMLTTDEAEPSPESLLARGRAFVKAQETASFTGFVRVDSNEPDTVADTFLQRLEVTGSVRLPDETRYAVTSQGFASEVIAAGGRRYTRNANPGVDVRRKRWAASDSDISDQRSGVVRPQRSRAKADTFADPIGLLRTLDTASRPILLRRGANGSVIKANVEVDNVYGGAVAGEIASALELTLDGDRVDRVVLTAAGDATSVVVHYRFTQWGTSVKVEAPPRSGLDPTPGIEEEEIAAFQEAPLLQPRGIPAGWVLEVAGVVPKQLMVEGCAAVELDYIEPDDPVNGYLRFYELPKSCADLVPPQGSRPFRAGRSTGWLDEDQDGATALIVVGVTALQVETDLSLDALKRILADLVPLDLGSPPAELPGFGPTTAA